MAQNVEVESILNLKNRKELTLTGVEKVCSVSETQAKIQVAGSVLLIFGKDIKMKKLNVEAGEIVMEGLFDSFKFSAGRDRSGFFKRLFKWFSLLTPTSLFIVFIFLF